MQPDLRLRTGFLLAKTTPSPADAGKSAFSGGGPVLTSLSDTGMIEPSSVRSRVLEETAQE
jgi:hypothetical protein